MPHVKINYPRQPLPPQVAERPELEPARDVAAKPQPAKDQLVVAWNGIGWVTVSLYPDGWQDTGDAEHVQLNPQELDLLIRTLQKARRKAYGKGQRWYGYEDGPAVEARPLFNPRPR